MLPQISDQDLYQRYTHVLKTCRISQESGSQIEKDIKRTFSAKNYFNDEESNKGYMRLKRLLTAISSFKDVGYVQGMNYIAASLLWHCDEDISYHILVTLFERLEAHKNYQNDLSGIQSNIENFHNSFLKTHSNEIYSNLESKEIIPQMIFPEWFVTMGTSIIPLKYHVHVFYNLIQHNWSYLFNVLRNYLRLLYPYFKDEDFPSSVLIIKNGKFEDGKTIDINWQKIIGVD